MPRGAERVKRPKKRNGSFPLCLQFFHFFFDADFAEPVLPFLARPFISRLFQT
jgi:hypothetical protein